MSLSVMIISTRDTENAFDVAPTSHLLESATTLKRLRILCETESPLPLRRRGLYAPPNFLEFA